ncbi:hypothetical protein IFM89_035856 [Coptis chinensis]|uniref:Aminotransferase-like plant mobile domain-containing protein n=1 Tax=Coptis chinensis TaxID=261450 RepID=A0A835H2T5_9MAGN|nr:hypothetical protein IFM89_035856 [Coptis chinensis]
MSAGVRISGIKAAYIIPLTTDSGLQFLIDYLSLDSDDGQAHVDEYVRAFYRASRQTGVVSSPQMGGFVILLEESYDSVGVRISGIKVAYITPLTTDSGLQFLMNYLSLDSDDGQAHVDEYVRAFSDVFDGCFFFFRGHSTINLGYLTNFEHLHELGGIDFGGAIYFHLLRCLDRASRQTGVVNSPQMGGFVILLEVWFYEYFCAANPILTEYTDERPRLRAWHGPRRARQTNWDVLKSCELGYRVRADDWTKKSFDFSTTTQKSFTYSKMSHNSFSNSKVSLRHKRRRSTSSSESPINNKSSSSSVGAIDRKNAIEKLKIEEEEKQRLFLKEATAIVQLVIFDDAIGASFIYRSPRREAELKLLEEETMKRVEEAIRKQVEERLNSEEVKARDTKAN